VQSRDELFKMAETLGGMVVLDCAPNGPAAGAGIRYGDILLMVNGKPTPNVLAYLEAIEITRDVEVQIFRDGETRTLRFFRKRNEEADIGEIVAGLLARRVLPA
jgi:S1-C subfamily serine protease